MSWITNDLCPRWNVAGDDGAGAHEGSRPDRNSWKNKCARADEGAWADDDRRRLQFKTGARKIVSAGAKVGFLGHRGPGLELDRAEAIRVGAITQAGAIVQGQIPWMGDSSPLMDEGPAGDARAENS